MFRLNFPFVDLFILVILLSKGKSTLCGFINDNLFACLGKCLDVVKNMLWVLLVRRLMSL